MAAQRAWIVPTGVCHAPWLRLFCFPFAGGGAGLFRPWPVYFAALGIDVCAVRLPGRDDRFGEEPEVDIRVLAKRAGDGIAEQLDVPYALFGHSMGALLAYELALCLRQRGARSPSRVIVSACRAPHLPDPEPHICKLSAQEIVAELRRYGGTASEILDNPEMLELALPLLRADAQLTEAYRHVETPPLTSPICAIHPEADDLIARDDMAAWQRYTAGQFRLDTVAGGHFAVREEPAGTMEIVAEELLPLRSGQGS
jgi:surfactin synthase thioesterase subunit